MPSILEIFQKSTPNTAKANSKGTDRTPIGNDDPNGEFTPSKNLMKDEARLTKARRGSLPKGVQNPYGKTDRNK